jgi:hypothetical protein
VGRFWGDERLPDPDIIVFGPSKSTEAQYRPDEEKSDTRALIDRDGTCNTIALSNPSMFQCAAQYLSSNRRQVGLNVEISTMPEQIPLPPI